MLMVGPCNKIPRWLLVLALHCWLALSGCTNNAALLSRGVAASAGTVCTRRPRCCSATAQPRQPFFDAHRFPATWQGLVSSSCRAESRSCCRRRRRLHEM
jgi:hypothetical protein